MSNKIRTGHGLRARGRGLIHSTLHSNLNETVTDAIERKIDLEGIELSGQSLRGLNLDGVTLANADFSGTDLTGANLTEAKFVNCDFSNSVLFDTCFSYSDLENCSFEDASFGLTDFSQSSLQSCTFGGMSIFSVNLAAAKTLKQSRYIWDAQCCSMSQPPTVLYGLKYPIIIFDEKLMIDGDIYDIDRARLFAGIDSLLIELLKKRPPFRDR